MTLVARLFQQTSQFYRAGLFILAIFGCAAPNTAAPNVPPPSSSALLSVQTRPQHDGKVILFGNLHAHSTLSDDVSDNLTEAQPAKGFAYAQAHGLDFLAISDHHMATDASGRLWMTAAEYANQLFQVAMDHNTAQQDKFIAIPAIEWGNIATGNHLNVFGASTLPPDTILNKEYDKLYAWAKQHVQFVQFNHPSSWREKSNRDLTVGNFGESLAAFGSPEAFRDAADPVTATVSIISTVKGGHISGQFKNSEQKTHRELHLQNYSHYRRLLNLGFKISPAANQDTHGKNFGTVTAARTAVWADSPSYASLMAAIKANRVYATEDDEMVVAFQVKYKDKTYWMGETVPLEAEEAEVQILVKVWQAQGTDNDPTDEGPYTVEIIADPDGIGGQEPSKLGGDWTVQSNQQTVIPFMAARGRYLYLRILEQGGKDNPIGDGDDSDGDGKRDDLDDSAWTSPIWFGADPPATFVWSVNSSVYHDANCWAVKSIGAANRREGPAPDGKTKHNCHP